MITQVLFMTGQPINPSVTPDFVLPGGPYTNVENTGADLSVCLSHLGSCTVDAQAFCWDGDNPGIATTYSAPGTVEILSLPAGAHDPDIVFTSGGTLGMVVFELGNDVLYQTFTNLPGGGSLAWSGSGTVQSNASHPNIDRLYECEGYQEQVVVVYEDNTLNDIAYKEGLVASGSFPVTSTQVPLANFLHAGSPTPQARFHPDVAVLYPANSANPYDIFFTCVNVDAANNFYVEGYWDNTPSNPPGLNLAATGPVSMMNPDQTHPRIDGILAAPVYNYNLSVTYHSDDQIYQSFNNHLPFTPAIHPAGANFNELPAVAYGGDYSAVIWASDALGGRDIIGQEWSGSARDPFYQEATSPPRSTVTTNFYPSIAGNCTGSGTYAMCWYDPDTEDIIFKYANMATTAFKRDPEDLNDPKSGEDPFTVFPTFINKDHFDLNPWLQDSELYFYDLQGQLVLNATAGSTKNLASLPGGIYVVMIKSGKAKAQRKKVLLR